MGSTAGLSLPCVSVASGHTWGTQLLQPGFGMDREPGDAAREVSPSVTMAMAAAKPLLVPASMEQLPRGALAPEPLAGCGENRGAREPSRAPSHSHYLLPPSAPCQKPDQALHKATTPAPAQGGGSGLSPLAGCPHCTVTTGISQRSQEPGLSSMCSAPGRFTATTGEAHVPHGVPSAAGGNTDGRVSRALQSVPGHENNKDSRLLWMGSSDFLISVGFSQVRSSPGRLPRCCRAVPALLPAVAVLGPQVLFGWPDPMKAGGPLAR